MARCRVVVVRSQIAADTADTSPQKFQQARVWDELWNEKDPYGDALEAQRSALEGSQKKRVLLLIADTGGGHRSSARAVADALEELHPDEVDLTIRDVWTERCPWPFNRVVQSYMWMAQRPWFWRVFFLTSKFPITRWISQRFANVRCKRAFRHAIEEANPDLILSLHPCTQHITIKVLRRLARRTRRRIPFVTIVTDLGGAHPMWFHPEADRVFVPSESVRDLALRCGVRESAIEMHGLPLRRAFWSPEPRSREEVRQTLGLQPELLTVLVIGGGDGVGKLQQVANALGKRLGSGLGGAQVQLVAICGKNEKVRRNLSARKWPEQVHVKVLGFVSNVHEWMAAANVIVTKAGPGTIAESCTRHLPVMLSSYLPGQEHGNVGFVVDGRFGEYCNNPKEIAATVTSWLNDPEKLREMSHWSAEHGRPAATLKIAEAIGKQWLRPVDGIASESPAPVDRLERAQAAVREGFARGTAALEKVLSASPLATLRSGVV